MLKQIHHKRNEKKEAEFFQNEECTIPFDFTNTKDLYVQGDIATLMDLFATQEVDCEANIYIPYLTTTWNELCLQDLFSSPVQTLNDITPNLSKYIPEDNAVLFLNGEKISLIDYDTYYDMFDGYRDIEFEGKIIKGMPYHPQIYGIHRIRDMVYIHKHEYNIDDYTNFSFNILKGKKLTIFLSHGTQAELEKAEEVSKYLWKNFKIKPNLCALHWFVPKKLFIETLRPSKADRMYRNEIYGYAMKKICKNINKIITTNSTGVLPVQDKERLQVIDCKEIFEDFLNENN